MKKLLILAAVVASALVANIGMASAGSPRATVSHFTARDQCSCFVELDFTGVHLTNTQFPGVDNGPTAGTTTGGRDNFSGTVARPPDSEVTVDGSGCTDPQDGWQSDYNHNLFTCDFSWTIEPDGSTSGWAIYPNAS
jgi:hypothetical protein